MEKTESLQSAYKWGHSTKTALFKVMTDMLAALDNAEITCLVFLNLSVAFDMVSHTLLLKGLNTDSVSLAVHPSPLLLETWTQRVQNLMEKH